MKGEGGGTEGGNMCITCIHFDLHLLLLQHYLGPAENGM